MIPHPPTSDELLWRHLKDLPYFRAMVRAVEANFYDGLDLPGPVLDLGSGDGHFTSVAFDHPLDVGLDPWWPPLYESRTRKAYRMLIQADGARTPFPTGFFASAVSNSVLEHIPNVDNVVDEIARVVRPGGRFVFCVPNHRFPEMLLGSAVFRAIGFKGVAASYTNLFQRISRHKHCDSYDVWQERLANSGFSIEKHWDYFSPSELYKMEVGHAFGLPSLIWKKVAGRWLLAPVTANLWLAYLIARPSFRSPLSENGVYSFYITRRVGLGG